MNRLINHQLLNKGYFSNLNKKIIFSVYMMIKNEFKKKLGRKCKVILLEQNSSFVAQNLPLFMVTGAKNSPR